MYNPTAITTLPNVASASTPAVSNVDIPVGNASGAMAVTAGIGYSVLVTAVSFALGHVLGEFGNARATISCTSLTLLFPRSHGLIIPWIIGSGSSTFLHPFLYLLGACLGRSPARSNGDIRLLPFLPPFFYSLLSRDICLLCLFILWRIYTVSIG